MDEVRKKWNSEDEDDIIWGVDLLYKSEFVEVLKCIIHM